MRLRSHARGGLGRVSVAREVSLDRQVAIKEIREELANDKESRRRFVREAEITGQLEHPGVVPIYSLDRDNLGRPYYAMRFVRGRTLGDAIAEYHARPDALTFRDLLNRFVSVCRTLAYAHSRGAIHRDLKPANVMLGDYGETLVVDWGLAKRDSTERDSTETEADRPDPREHSDIDNTPQLTQAGQVLGTPAFMSPEQASGDSESLTASADVYSLGAVLYTLLCGRPPFDGTDAMHIVTQVVANAPPSPRSRAAAVPKALSAIAIKAMARLPDDRYSSAAELADDVGRWLGDEPVSAWRDPMAVRLARWSRRHRAWVSGTAALLLTAVVALSIGTVALGSKNRQIRYERDVAQEERNTAQKEAAKATAINKFLKDDLLAEASPERNAVGDQLTVRVLLDRASKRVDGAFPDQPEVEATIRATIGDAYYDLGAFADAERHFRKMLALREEFAAADDVALYDAMHALALSLGDQAKYSQAERYYRAAIEGFRRLKGAEHRFTLTTANNLAEVVRSKGDRRQAAELHQQNLETRRKVLGSDDADTLESMNNLGAVYAQLHDYAKAEPLLRDCWQGRRRVLGERHPETLTALTNLGVVLKRQRKYDEAEPIYRLCFEESRRVQGPEHPDVLTCMHNLASMLRARNKHDESEKTYREALRLRRKVLTSKHPAVARTLMGLADLLRDLKRDEEAEALLREALSIFTDTYEKGHWRISDCQAALGECLISRKRYVDAEPLLLSSFEAYKADPKESAENRNLGVDRLVRLYVAWNKPESAAAWQARRTK